ncbi:hypothetical protein PUR50_25775, partial [Enterobacter hormaechei subsp. steigerwaltii]|nr:hypothetical protein [Enterobacter hormaechei subsp. steigerwaltii]
ISLISSIASLRSDEKVRSSAPAPLTYDTTSELKNPERNISMGTAYLSILEHGILKGIDDPEVMQYALV